MSAQRPSAVAPVCLVLGALLGMAGSFAPSAALWAAALLSEPLPFFAYPVLVLTLLCWAWWCRKPMPSESQ